MPCPGDLGESRGHTHEAVREHDPRPVLTGPDDKSDHEFFDHVTDYDAAFVARLEELEANGVLQPLEADREFKARLGNGSLDE